MIAQKPLLQCLVDLANSGSRVVAKTATKADIWASAALKRPFSHLWHFSFYTQFSLMLHLTDIASTMQIFLVKGEGLTILETELRSLCLQQW